MFDWIKDWFKNLIDELFYLVGIFFMKILHYLSQMFEVFTGMKKVTYYDHDNYLINVFFSNTTITTVYGGMELLGFIILMVMTIFAVYKKMHDLGDRMQSSMSEILRRAFTSFLFIISMNFIMLASLNITNAMLRTVEYLFDNAYALGQPTVIYFTNDQYAAMARCFNTIGNYSLSKSYTSRYNLNACFNEIREDMLYLEDTNMFSFTYDIEEDGEKVESWQSILSQIARTADLTEDLPLDEYNSAVSSAILDAMEYCRQNNNDMTVLQSYSQGAERAVQTDADIDVLFWLSASVDAARNNNYNGENASLTDPVRNPYRIGERSIYSMSTVEDDFTLDLNKFNHLIVIIGGAWLCYEYAWISINAISRIFNMLVLYLLAPPLIATAPFDDGERFRQWSGAFIVQAFGVFGTIVAIRLLMLMIPIVYDSNLVILNTGILGCLAKMVIVVAMAITAHKATGLIGGLLSGNGAGASAQTLDQSHTALRQYWRDYKADHRGGGGGGGNGGGGNGGSGNGGGGNSGGGNGGGGNSGGGNSGGGNSGGGNSGGGQSNSPKNYANKKTK